MGFFNKMYRTTTRAWQWQNDVFYHYFKMFMSKYENINSYKEFEMALQESGWFLENLPNQIYQDLVEAFEYKLGFTDKKPVIPLPDSGWDSDDYADGPNRPMPPLESPPTLGHRKSPGQPDPPPDPKRPRADTDVTDDDASRPQDILLVMSGLTSLNNSHDMVDLGHIKAYVQKFHLVDKKELGQQNYTVSTTHQFISTTADDVCRFESLGAGQLVDGSALAGAAPNPVFTAADEIMTMNGVATCQTFKSQLTGFSEPVYGAGNVGLSEIGSSDRAFILNHQYVEFRFKNLSNAGTDFANVKTPVKITVYSCKVIEDIFAPQVTTAVAEGSIFRQPLNFELATGFLRETDGNTGAGLAGSTNSQPFYVTAGDNDVFNTKLKIVDSKKFALHLGQVATLRCVIKVPQYHNFHHLLRGSPAGNTSTGGSSDYRGVVHKGGETVFVVKVEGQIYGTNATATTDRPTVLTTEPFYVGVKMIKKVSYTEILRSHYEGHYDYDPAQAAGAFQADIDAFIKHE